LYCTLFGNGRQTFLLTDYYSGDRIENNDRRGERYPMYGERIGSYKVLVEKHEGKSNSEDLVVDGRVILK